MCKGVIKFHKLGFPLSPLCYEKLQKISSCQSVAGSPLIYKNLSMVDYLNKHIVRDLNWKYIKNFIIFKTGLEQFLAVQKLQTTIAGRVFAYNRFSNHISSFCGWIKK